MRDLEWRLFGVEVSAADDDDGINTNAAGGAAGNAVGGGAYNRVPTVTWPLHEAVAARLSLSPEQLPIERIQLVRRSLDARPQRSGGRRGRPTGQREVSWSHVVDVKLDAAQAKRIKAQPGRIVPAAKERIKAPSRVARLHIERRRHVVVVGAGPCGLFAALSLARAGVEVTLCERGKPVEERGRSIGALIKRRVLDADSNFCYGEGGAGTWSDGKLTTRIGRNSADVRHVLETLVRFGAPERILLDGKPHLGTDNLVRLLKAFRAELVELGATIKWDARVESLLMTGSSTDTDTDDDGSSSSSSSSSDRRVAGVKLFGGEELRADAVVLAAGHSARELYTELIRCGAKLTPKDFAVGFRIEHPQEVINAAQYGEELAGAMCQTGGRGALPPASYRLAATVDASEEDEDEQEDESRPEIRGQRGRRVNKGSSKGERGVYSFCMCPGGQIVPTSLRPDELCVNGMSYSNRGSKWANSAVVVSVGASYGDYGGGAEGSAAGSDGGEVAAKAAALPPELAGLAFQEAMEARAAVMGGGDLRCPVQTVRDFLDGSPTPSRPLPPSSYRLGVTAAPLHELYPPPITAALREGLKTFAASMKGFDCDEALLHGVETRTSAPVRIERDGESCEAVELRGLYPAGEGAGFAGGIVSAAVDGVRVADALLESVGAAAGGASGGVAAES